jgi:hypothetical protein
MLVGVALMRERVMKGGINSSAEKSLRQGTVRLSGQCGAATEQHR